MGGREKAPLLNPGGIPPGCEMLVLPDWLPVAVGDFVHSSWVKLHRSQAEQEVRDLLCRLASDPRMKNVWNELNKRERNPDRKYVHPATDIRTWSDYSRHRSKYPEHRQYKSAPRADVTAAYEALMLTASYSTLEKPLHSQDLAMAYFFDEAFCCARTSSRLIYLPMIKKNRRHYLKMSERLRVDAAERKQIGFYDTTWMLEAADRYEEMAEPAPGRSLLVTRQPHGDPRVKSFVLLLSDTSKTVFGSPLYGCIATVANVALNRNDLTHSTVRKMLAPCR